MTTAGRLTVGLVLSGAGHVVHNVAEFGVAGVAGGETLVPVAVTGALVAVATAWRKTRRVTGRPAG